MIENLHEKIFFGKKVYCRGFLPIHTPKKQNNENVDTYIEPKTTESNNTNTTGSPSPKSKIPGLPNAEIKKAERKKGKDDKKKEKKQREEKRKENEKLAEKKVDGATRNKSTAHFMKDPVQKDFTFTDSDNGDSSSDEEPKGIPWTRSPLESEDPDQIRNIMNLYSFKSLSATEIQKEELGLKPAFKRSLSSPTDGDSRRIRSRSQAEFSS